MIARTVTALVVLAFGLACSGCAAGPGHTRAAGAGIGTGAGALIGSAVAGRGNRGTGAVLGGILGYVAGSSVGEGIAQDQEQYNSPPHRGSAQPRRVIRRRYVRPRCRRVVYEEVIEEEVIEVPAR